MILRESGAPVIEMGLMSTELHLFEDLPWSVGTKPKHQKLLSYCTAGFMQLRSDSTSCPPQSDRHALIFCGFVLKPNTGLILSMKFSLVIIFIPGDRGYGKQTNKKPT